MERKLLELDQLDTNLKEYLNPMYNILDYKNIKSGVKTKLLDDKIYIYFDKASLSDLNKAILRSISHVYCETLFYSDDFQTPNNDRLECWCPDEEFEKSTHIIERCQNKKFFVLELDLYDLETLLGITILLAQTLQLQDPLELKIYENADIIESDIMHMYQNFINTIQNYPRYINLTVSLNDDNPLRENPYAKLVSVNNITEFGLEFDSTKMNSSIEVQFKTFCLNRVNLANAIREYFDSSLKPQDKESIFIPILKS